MSSKGHFLKKRINEWRRRSTAEYHQKTQQE